MKRNPGGFLVWVLLMIMAVFWFTSAVSAWKINTHLYIAEVIMDDARDGKVYIPPFGEFEISEMARQALNYPDFYRGGNIGPDGFPDMLTGQSCIHPNTDPWLQVLWDQAEREDCPEVWSFTMGFFTHAGGDMWAHDWVNHYAGGAFPDLAEFRNNQAEALLNATRHMAIENTFENGIPVHQYQINIPDEFVLNTLILGDKARSIGLPDWLGTLVDLYWDKYNYRNDTILGVDTYNANWFEDLEDGFNAWVAANKQAMQSIASGEKDMLTALNESWTDWALGNYLDMLGVPSIIADSPDRVVKALNYLPDEIERLLTDLGVIKMLKDMEDNFVNWILETAIGLNKKEVEIFFNRNVDFTLFGDSYQDIITEIGEIPLEKNWVHSNDNKKRYAEFLQTINSPLYNSIITGKLALLPPDELNRLLRVNIYKNRGNGRNVMLGVLDSIDESRQWASGLGGFYIFEMPLPGEKTSVFEHIYKPYFPAASAEGQW